jgi:hypothetical protein
MVDDTGPKAGRQRKDVWSRSEEAGVLSELFPRGRLRAVSRSRPRPGPEMIDTVMLSLTQALDSATPTPGRTLDLESLKRYCSAQNYADPTLSFKQC